MRSYAKQLFVVALLLGFCVSFSGCLKTEITTGKQPGNETVELSWAHGLAYGLVPPINGPLKVERCDNGIAEVSFKQTFIQGFVQNYLTGAIYNPQRFTVTCASGGSMSSLEAPPSYLLRGSEVEASSQQLATAK